MSAGTLLRSNGTVWHRCTRNDQVNDAFDVDDVSPLTPRLALPGGDTSHATLAQCSVESQAMHVPPGTCSSDDLDPLPINFNHPPEISAKA